MLFEPQLANNPNQLAISFGGYSDAGVKKENQDAFSVSDTQGQERYHKGLVATLADGCSSASKAKEAAQLAVTSFVQEYLQTPPSWSTHKSAAKVLSGLNQWLYSQGSFSGGLSQQYQADWLTTFSTLIIKSATAYIFHVGDSQIARIRGDEVEPITRNHSCNNQLTKALGAELHLEADAYRCELQQGDIFMLSSDGVYQHVKNNEITAIIANSSDLESASKAICREALSSGSDDNVSCLLVKVNSLAHKNLDEIYNSLTSRKIPPVLKVGQKLDDYTILRELHASTRSHLYLAQKQGQLTPVVLKTPSLNFADDVVYLQGFLRESWVGQQVKHPNVMKVLETAEQSRFLYHICEYVDGQTLTEWMSHNPKPDIAKVNSILQQIILALRAFQRLDMVHRDLKPENVMIDSHGQIKLIDYGTVAVASLNEQEQHIEEECPQGSANYIAPETLLEMKVDFRSDMFSLGVIGYELLSGRLPYKIQNGNSNLPSDYQFWQYKSIKQQRQDIPLWLDLVLMRATDPNPDKRYLAFSELSEELKTPNLQAEQVYKQAPLLQRDPVKFWQLISLVLLILLLLK